MYGKNCFFFCFCVNVLFDNCKRLVHRKLITPNVDSILRRFKLFTTHWMYRGRLIFKVHVSMSINFGSQNHREWKKKTKRTNKQDENCVDRRERIVKLKTNRQATIKTEKKRKILTEKYRNRRLPHTETFKIVFSISIFHVGDETSAPLSQNSAFLHKTIYDSIEIAMGCFLLVAFKSKWNIEMHEILNDFFFGIWFGFGCSI